MEPIITDMTADDGRAADGLLKVVTTLMREIVDDDAHTPRIVPLCFDADLMSATFRVQAVTYQVKVDVPSALGYQITITHQGQRDIRFVPRADLIAPIVRVYLDAVKGRFYVSTEPHRKGKIPNKLKKSFMNPKRLAKSLARSIGAVRIEDLDEFERLCIEPMADDAHAETHELKGYRLAKDKPAEPITLTLKRFPYVERTRGRRGIVVSLEPIGERQTRPLALRVFDDTKPSLGEYNRLVRVSDAIDTLPAFGEGARIAHFELARDTLTVHHPAFGLIDVNLVKTRNPAYALRAHTPGGTGPELVRVLREERFVDTVVRAARALNAATPVIIEASVDANPVPAALTATTLHLVHPFSGIVYLNLKRLVTDGKTYAKSTDIDKRPRNKTYGVIRDGIDRTMWSFDVRFHLVDLDVPTTDKHRCSDAITVCIPARTYHGLTGGSLDDAPSD